MPPICPCPSRRPRLGSCAKFPAMSEPEKKPAPSKTPERGTAEAAQKERGKPSDSAVSKEGASSRGKEPISTQNRTSTEE